MCVDNKSLYIFQSCVSLLVHSLMVWINLDMGWASIGALWYTAHMMMFYEMFDMSVGWQGYWKKDKLMLVHHGITWGAGWALLRFLGSEDEEIVRAVCDAMYWGMLSQVTTVFNALRIIGGSVGPRVGLIMRGVFAVVFCLLRGVQTVGMAREIWLYWNNPFVWCIVVFWTVFTAMNLFWMWKIIVTFGQKVGWCGLRSLKNRTDVQKQHIY